MKGKIPTPVILLGLIAGLILFAAALILDDSIPAPASGLCCGIGGVLLGLCGTALGLSWADRSLTPEQRREVEVAEQDERNVAIREKAAYTSWYWTLYLLWAAFFLTLVLDGGFPTALVSVVIVLHCVFLMVNMRRWGKKL